MNLADAIRRASQEPGQSLVSEAPTAFAYASTTVEITTHEEVNQMDNPSNQPVAELNTSEELNPQAPLPISPMVTSGSAVRLELFLSPDQLTHVLRAVVEGQHNVLTLREAASYLRIQPKSLEQMASTNQVPAFQIDGRWRFAKPALDEWMAIRSINPEEGANAA